MWEVEGELKERGGSFEIKTFRRWRWKKTICSSLDRSGEREKTRRRSASSLIQIKWWGPPGEAEGGKDRGMEWYRETPGTAAWTRATQTDRNLSSFITHRSLLLPLISATTLCANQQRYVHFPVADGCKLQKNQHPLQYIYHTATVWLAWWQVNAPDLA